MIKVGIITASDRCSQGKRQDLSGLLLKSLVEDLPGEVVVYQVFPDDKTILKKAMCHTADEILCDLILTTGGTGLAPRDCTPEATREIIEKEVPGIPEAIRLESFQKTNFAMLSRTIAGVRGKTLIINLPGSPAAVRDAFNVLKPILNHAIELIRGEVTDCQKLSHSLPSHSSSH